MLCKKVGGKLNEHLFLKQLQMQLRGLPEEEIETIIQDYASYFAEAQNSGLTEEEAAKNLGHPFEIAQDIKASRKQGYVTQSINSSQTRIIIVGLGLIFFNLIIVLGPALGIIGAFFGIVVSCFSFLVSPMLVLGRMFFKDGHVFDFFFSLVLCGFGILVLPYLFKVAKKGQHFLQRYIDWNMKLVRGEGL